MSPWLISTLGMVLCSGVILCDARPRKAPSPTPSTSPGTLAPGTIATTPDGTRVLLRSDGTWKVVPTEGPQMFMRPATSTMPVELLDGAYTLFIHPEKWIREPKREEGRLLFRHRQGDGYAMIITERLAMGLAFVRMAAITNAQEAAPDLRVVAEERRQVNGLEVLWLHMQGTIQGFPFVYYGYYVSSAHGTMQLLTYTGTALFENYRQDFDEFLNGLTAKN